MEFQVFLTPKADRDLEQIGRYIAFDNNEAAREFCHGLLHAANSLSRMPRRGQAVNQTQNIYKSVHKSYLIFYKINEGARTVEILRFSHAAQDRRRLRLRETSPQYSVSGNTETELLKEALLLPPAARAGLVDKIMESLGTEIDPAIEQSHLATVVERRSGTASLVPGEDVLRRARNI